MKNTCFIVALLCLFMVGCKPEADVPTVITQYVSEVTDHSAKITCNVTDDGGADVTSRGICWSTMQTPTINDNKTNDGSGIGVYVSELQDLMSDTTYYVRAYAVNSSGIAYGEELNFVTLSDNEEGGDDEENVMGDKTITVNGVTFTMKFVEGGTFNMGAQKIDPEGINYDSEAWDREGPVHLVTLSDYYIAEVEVTQELWETVMGINPSHFLGEQRPVEQVNWYSCQSFIQTLNQMTGLNFRFPTEAEWEFAARGGNKSQGYKYSGSDILADVAWYSADGKKTRDVKTKMPNELGIYDMCGNVMEWCQDLYGDYTIEPQTNPTGALSGTDYIVRGGCCLSDENYCRLSIRSFFNPGGQSYGIGLRLAMDAEF